MIIHFLEQKSKLTKLFRQHGYKVSYDSMVCTDRYPSNIDLTMFFKDHAIKIEGRDRQVKKKRGYKESSIVTIGGRTAELLKSLNKERESFAFKIAERVHAIKSLYTSKRAGIISGSTGGVEEKDYEAYSKSYGFPAVWKNAGVTYSSKRINVYTSRGTLAFTMKMPKVKSFKKYLFYNFGVECVYGIKKANKIFELYNLKNKSFCVAKKMSSIDEKNEEYWEHGKSIEDIEKEHLHKRDLYERELKKKELSSRISRASQLALRLINNIDVTYDDARSVGYCKPGIENFIANHLEGKRIVKLSTLKKFTQTKKLVETVVLKAVEERFLAARS